jgi:hypothetical protein
MAFAGARWVAEAGSSGRILTIGAAILVGWLKARYVLDRAALRIVARIESRGDGRCLGGFLSWRSWMLVAAMIGLGRALRSSPLPLRLRGALYLAIGVGLAVASRRIWAAWRRDRRALPRPSRNVIQ